MLYEIMAHIHNFFPVDGGRQGGLFKIEDGTVSLDFLNKGQYFIIEGSTFNDEIVYQYPAHGMVDEEFEGTVVALKPSRTFLSVCDEIESWMKKYGSDTAKPFDSENFEGYSYTRAKNADGTQLGWKDAFADRLAPWRCL